MVCCLEVNEQKKSEDIDDMQSTKKLELEKDEELQNRVMERLGEIKFDHTGEQFAVELERRICGLTVKIPVMCVEIEGGDMIEDLISPAQLKELSKTPAQRRAEKAKEVISTVVVVMVVVRQWWFWWCWWWW